MAAQCAGIGIDRRIARHELRGRRAVGPHEIIERQEGVAVAELREVEHPHPGDIRRIAARGGEEGFTVDLRDVEPVDEDPVLRPVEHVHGALERDLLRAGPFLPVNDMNPAVGGRGGLPATGEEQGDQQEEPPDR